MSNREARTLFRAAGVISLAAMLGRITGYLREALLAARFGATQITDAYLVAQDLPVSLFAAVNVALVMVFIPVYRDVEQRRGPEAAWRLVSYVLNATLALAVVLVAIVWALAGDLLPRLVPGLPLSALQLAIGLTRIMLPLVLFTGLSGIASAVLNANHRFTAPALLGLMSNLFLVGTLLAVESPAQISWVAWAVVAGGAAGALMQLPLLPRLGFRYHLALDWRDPGLLQIGRLITPIVFTTYAVQLQNVVDRFLASHLAEGSISSLNYAVRVNSLPYGVIGVAISTVLYPRLAEYASSGDVKAMREAVSGGLRTLAFVLLPMAAGLLVFRQELVQLFLQRGAFDPRATASTAYALQFYALGILFFGWLDFVNRTYFVLQDTLTPMWASLGMVGLNIALNMALIGPLGHGGLALGTSLSTAIAVAFLLWRLGRRLGNLGGWQLVRSVATAALTTSAGTLSGYGFYVLAEGFLSRASVLSQALRLSISLGIIVIVHLGLSKVLGGQDGIRMLTDLGRKRSDSQELGRGSV